MSFFISKLLRIFFVFYIAAFGLARAQSLDSLALLIPDNVSSSDSRVGAWLDAINELGLHIEIIKDADVIKKGGINSKYRGLILPDQIHTQANDTLIFLINKYVNDGGKVMLVYDFAALTADGFYPIPKSRLSDLAGINYILYSQLGEQTIGLGLLTGQENILRSLQVPPGKSLPYNAPANVAARSINSGTGPTSSSASTDQILYLPANPKDAGGIKSYDPGQFHVLIDEHNPLSNGPLRSFSFAKKSSSNFYFSKAIRRNRTGQQTPTPIPVSQDIHTITGYLYGPLFYPSYVTTGNFSGTTLLSSPDFGLVAGVNKVGKGTVLFVNLPLTYLKGQTDGMLMHGFTNYFANNILGLPRLSSQPNGIGGLVLNWHLCSNFLIPMDTLKNQGVWNDGPFSIHMTAGPDTGVFSDGEGFNLRYNPAAQQYLRDFDKKGHAIGAHGGWIHDYYGLNVSESNQAEFQKYLEWNKSAIEKVIRHPIVEYAAPQGNNPLWAMDWLENNKFIGAYFTGHTGMAPTRHYRDNVLKNPNLWIFPVTTFGKYATFEEFQDNNVAKADVTTWYKSLVDFSALNNTSRLIYMHPNGAAEWSDVVQSLLIYAKQYSKAHKFNWYTMTELAQFNKRRQQVKWSETSGMFGWRIFTISHPDRLDDMTWILPKSAYSKPFITQGNANVKAYNGNWLITARNGNKVSFASYPR